MYSYTNGNGKCFANDSSKSNIGNNNIGKFTKLNSKWSIHLFMVTINRLISDKYSKCYSISNNQYDIYSNRHRCKRLRKHTNGNSNGNVRWRNDWFKPNDMFRSRPISIYIFRFCVWRIRKLYIRVGIFNRWRHKLDSHCKQ